MEGYYLLFELLTTVKLIKCTLIVFTDQLVHYAMQKQNPEMNEKSKEIKLTRATLQKQQHELQVWYTLYLYKLLHFSSKFDSGHCNFCTIYN